jgi:hypothetical protein
MTSKASLLLVPDKRPLREPERAVIGWLLDHCDRGDEFRDQIDRVTVCSRCTCGCPTVNLASNGMPISRRGEILISDHLAEMNSELFGVMLFANDEVLSTLEVYSQTGNVKSFGLPTVEELFPWEGLTNHPSRGPK